MSNIIEKFELLTNQKYSEIDYIPIGANIWTKSLSKCLEISFPNVKVIAKRYKDSLEFYNYNKPILEFLTEINFVSDPSIIFSFDGKNLYSNQLPQSVYTSSKWQEEIFYSLIVNRSIYNIPSVHIAILEKIKSSNHYLYSDIPRIYPEKYFKELTSKYIENPISLINYILEIDYQPLTIDKIYVPSYSLLYKNLQAFELYIPQEDRCVLVPETIINKLTLEDIYNIKIKDGLLKLGDIPLHTLINKRGIYHKGALNLIDVD